MEVSARIARPGRSVELLEGELTVESEPVMTVRAWRVKASTAPDVHRDGPPPARPGEPSPPPPGLDDFGYGRAVELRFAAGGWGQRRPATVWTRLRVPVVAGEEPTGVQRVLAVADSGNGVSAVLSWDEWLFINPELTVHFRRPPRGDGSASTPRPRSPPAAPASRGRCSATTTAWWLRARRRCW